MQVVSRLFTITANPAMQTPDVSTSSIPTRAFSSKDQASLTGPTTGRVDCGFFGVFACKQGVSQVDVDGLVNQMQPSLERKITQGLQKQVEDAGGTTVGQVNLSIGSGKPNTPLGSEHDSVTVPPVMHATSVVIPH